MRVRARLVDWFRTRDGVAAAYLGYHAFYRGEWPADLTDAAARWALAAETAPATAEFLAATHPVWCDPPMVDLLAAAADTYPPQPLQPEQLLAPDGLVIFAKPLPAVWWDADTGEQTVDEPALTDQRPRTRIDTPAWITRRAWTFTLTRSWVSAWRVCGLTRDPF